jgi:hypothetical protein
MLLREIKTLLEVAPVEGQPDLNATPNADPNAQQPAGKPEEKPEEDKPSGHKEDSKEVLTRLFNDADEANELASYQRQDTVDIRPAVDGEQVHISWPGEVAKVVTCKEGQMVVRKTEDIKKMKVIEEDELDEKYELINANEKPDAENYTNYRIQGEVLAFQYHEKETLDLNVSGHFIKIKPEEYIGHPVDNPKKLIVMSKVDFEKKYRLN